MSEIDPNDGIPPARIIRHADGSETSTNMSGDVHHESQALKLAKVVAASNTWPDPDAKDDLVERGVRLREEHPDWSINMVLAALNHGQASPEFTRARERCETFQARFDATGGWMVFP